MYRIRFHGRGGQGMKTASRMLGTALLLEGFEVQDAPRYGAERRGAPIFAYVRADRAPINERGVIGRPDLVVVADDTLVGVPAAGVMLGVSEGTVLLIYTDEDEASWRQRLNAPGPILTLPTMELDQDGLAALVGAACAGAAARLLGVVSETTLTEAVRHELASMSEAIIAANLQAAQDAFERLAAQVAIVAEGQATLATGYAVPDWVELQADPVELAAPVIEGALTSVEVRTGLWRVVRPVIDYDRCNRCIWVCSSFCPDNAIHVRGDGYPEIDYDHCKGCMICVVQCPPHAIDTIAEQEAQRQEREEAVG